MPAPDIAVRAARESDHELIVEFNAQLALETEDKPLDRTRLSLGVQALLVDPAKGRYFVAEVDGALVGQLMVTTEWSDWRNGMLWWLGSVFVESEHRRCGVFRHLFNHVAALAQADPDVAGLRLYVEHENSNARRVYAQCGMEPAGYDVLEQLWERQRPVR